MKQSLCFAAAHQSLHAQTGGLGPQPAGVEPCRPKRHPEPAGTKLQLLLGHLPVPRLAPLPDTLQPHPLPAQTADTPATMGMQRVGLPLFGMAPKKASRDV